LKTQGKQPGLAVVLVRSDATVIWNPDTAHVGLSLSF
jgi:hypothetical protein